MGLPAIRSLEDVYRIGVFCHSKVKEDLQNPFAPVRYLSLLPNMINYWINFAPNLVSIVHADDLPILEGQDH